MTCEETIEHFGSMKSESTNLEELLQAIRFLEADLECARHKKEFAEADITKITNEMNKLQKRFDDLVEEAREKTLGGDWYSRKHPSI